MNLFQKLSPLLIVMAGNTSSFAEELKQYPLCNYTDSEDFKAPCQLKDDHASSEVLDMLIGNNKGFNKVVEKGTRLRRKYSDGFIIDEFRVIHLETKKKEHDGDSLIHRTKRFEILLWDCRGTDDCSSAYLWTVEKKTAGDIYTYTSKYTNKLEKTEVEELPKPVGALK